MENSRSVPCPDDWQVLPVGDLCGVLNGLAFKPEDWSRHGLPIIRIQNLNGSQDFNYWNGPVPDAYLIPPGTLLFSWSGNRGTSFGPYLWDGPSGVLNQHIFRINVQDGVDRRWLYYALNVVRMRVERAAHGGSGLVHVRKGDFLSYDVLAPPLAEQRRIAEILDTVDEAIRQTEQLIAKLKQMKQGLLHDLLTRGIDDNGELRDPEQHPEQFQDSPLGRIPREWDVSSVDVEFDISSGITLGPHRRPRKNTWPYLRVANVYRDALDLSDVALLEVLPREIEGRKLDEGDLLVVEGHANPEEIGRCAIATQEVVGYTFQNHLFCLRPRKLISRFGLRWMNSPWTQAYWRRMCSTSSGLNTINKTKLRTLEVLVPPRIEQERIVEMLESLVSHMDAERCELEKLRLLKQGMMEDLLTGRVRVTELENAK